MFFIALLVISAITLASAAAFFSVYGLAHTFSGAFWSVVVMGGSIEAGKLIAASALYRYWSIIPGWLRTFLIPGVLVGMFVTSMGIFGFLSAAYQQDTLTYKENEAQILLLREEQASLTERKKQIDQQVAQLPENYVTARQRLIKEFKSETDHINKRLPEITSEIQTLTKQQLMTETHVGPIIYIAKAFDRNVDDATKWLILLIIFIFDPMAIALTLLVNIAVKNRAVMKSKKPEVIEKIIEVVKEVPTKVEVIKEVPVEVTKEVPVEVYVPQPQKEEEHVEKKEHAVVVEQPIHTPKVVSQARPTKVEATVEDSKSYTGSISSSIIRSGDLPQHLRHPWQKGEALTPNAIKELVAYYKELAQKEKNQVLTSEEQKHKKSIVEILNYHGFGNYLK